MRYHMQVFVYSVESLNSPVYSAPHCPTYRTTVDRPPQPVGGHLPAERPQQQTRRTPLLRSTGQTDGRTDGQTADSKQCSAYNADSVKVTGCVTKASHGL